MNIKTLTAPSIHAALQEARRQFGDDVILLESFPPRENRPARITVMTDKATPVAKAPAPRLQPATAEAAPTAGTRFGYARARQLTPAIATKEEGTGRQAGFSSPATEPSTDVAVMEPPPVSSHRAPAPHPTPSGRHLPARGRLFPSEDAPNEETALAPSLKPISKMLASQMDQVHQRLQKLESRLGEAIVGSGQQWVVHPLYTALLDQRMQPALISRLFNSLAARALTPEHKMETLKWALAQELLHLINIRMPRIDTTNQLLIGPSGSGKTSLLLKLAQNPAFYGRRNTTIIVILPADEQALYQSPVGVYERFGFDVQAVRTAEEMRAALEHATYFDQVLIDTPSLPVKEAAARRMLRRVRRLVEPIMPLQIHLTINTNRVLEHFSADYLNHLPLQPDTLALTHLDETFSWGRIAEWLIALERPVHYVSTGPSQPEDVRTFSPTWFVEAIMNI